MLEEISGFSAVLGLQLEKNFYFSYSFLSPSCSQLAIKHSPSYQDPSVLVRNYDFDLDTEDFVIVKYKIKDKYSFIGTSMMTFGIDSGVNEHGLAVSMSACGPPVGVFQEAKTAGLRFWVAIRVLLENCETAVQAKKLLDELPLSDNISYLCMDKKDDMLIYQIVNGVRDYKFVQGGSQDFAVYAANHPTFPKIIEEFPYGAYDSLVRYENIKNYLSNQGKKSLADIRTLFTKPYPEGLHCNYYGAYFGTTKSVVLYPKEGKLEICWCGFEKNGWRSYEVQGYKDEETYLVDYEEENPPENMFEPVKLK